MESIHTSENHFACYRIALHILCEVTPTCKVTQGLTLTLSVTCLHLIQHDKIIGRWLKVYV